MGPVSYAGGLGVQNAPAGGPSQITDHNNSELSPASRIEEVTCRRIHAGQERERQREAKNHNKQRISLTPRPKETADLEFRRTPKFTQDCEHTHRTPSTRQYERSVLRQSGTGEFKNILRAPKGARHSCEVVSPLTDPLVHWPEGAHRCLARVRKKKFISARPRRGFALRITRREKPNVQNAQ